MLRPLTEITITQNPSVNFPSRNKVLFFNFVTELEATNNWKNFTNTAKIIQAKKIFYREQTTNKLIPLDKNLGGFSGGDPYFLRGDSVSIKYGYKYFDKSGNEITSIKEIFKGFISRVGSKTVFTLECEDNMFLLKGIAAKNKYYKSTVSLKTIIEDLVSGTNFTVKSIGDNFIGEFNTSSTETVAQVLERLRKDYRIESYFRGDELRTGVLIYDEAESLARERQQKKTFNFNETIIEDDLQYTRKDEVKISAKCISINKKELAETTRDGAAKTKKERLEVVVGVEGGETRTLHFFGVTDINKLKELGEAELNKYFYDGFRGSFKTFALPFLQCGDNIFLENPELPEQDGKYRVKEVVYTGGVNGHFQKVFLDYKLPG